MRFSDRIGATKISLDLFVDSIPESLRNSIWNFILELYPSSNPKCDQRTLCVYLAKHFRKSRVDEVPNRPYDVSVWLKDYYFSLSWDQVYNLVEFLVQQQYYIVHYTSGYQVDQRRLKLAKEEMKQRFNLMFEMERSGFRFIDGVLSPITDKLELDAVSESIDQLDKLGLIGAKKHIQTSLELFSKRPKPDYRNSIKESISAVESVVKILGSKDGDGISFALKVLSEKANLHGALKSAFEKLYGFTSDDDGIRHAMIDDPSVGFDESKYMIIACSAFCSYLTGKAQSANLIKKVTPI
jgi:hypothetical protein